MSGEGIAAILIALGTLAVSLINARNNAKKADIDALRQIIDQQAQTLERQSQQIEELENKVKEMDAQLEKQKTRNKRLWTYIGKLLETIRCLRDQIRSASLDPCAEAPEWVEEE